MPAHSSTTRAQRLLASGTPRKSVRGSADFVRIYAGLLGLASGVQASCGPRSDAHSNLASSDRHCCRNGGRQIPHTAKRCAEAVRAAGDDEPAGGWPGSIASENVL